MKRLAKPRGWEQFQHYKDRRPPWIKLHKALLDDRDFQRLPVASRALAPMLWLLASESDDGSLDVSIEELTFRLRQPESEILAGLKPLIESGFFSLEQPASDVLADREQLAPQRREETETEGEVPQDKPAPTPRAKREKSPELILADWLEQERQAGRKAISDYTAVWDFADKVGIPREWVEMGWVEFKRQFIDNPKYSTQKQKDWRAHFANFVRKGWLHLWELERATGQYRLTLAGTQLQRELEAQEVAA